MNEKNFHKGVCIECEYYSISGDKYHHMGPNDFGDCPKCYVRRKVTCPAGCIGISKDQTTTEPSPQKMVEVNTRVSINVYEIISRAVEEGVKYGYNRAYKHTDKPDHETVKEAIETAVMSSLMEVLKIDD